MYQRVFPLEQKIVVGTLSKRNQLSCPYVPHAISSTTEETGKSEKKELRMLQGSFSHLLLHAVTNISIHLLKDAATSAPRHLMNS